MGIVSRSQGASGSAALLFDSTLGADSGAGIDTGAGGIAQTATLLEVWIYARTDEVIVHSQIGITLNNDGSAIYDRVFGQFANVTASANNAVAQTSWGITVPGASQAAGVYGALCILIPNYTGTVAQKAAFCSANSVGTAAANTDTLTYGLNYRSTTAISRLKAIQTGGTVLKAGTRVTIYGR